MKKHECRIDTSNTIRGDDWDYTCHPILAIEEDGFIKGRDHLTGDTKGDTLGHFCKNKGNDQRQPYWWWSLRPFDHGGRERQSNKHFSSEAAAITSLRKALNRKGYRLVA